MFSYINDVNTEQKRYQYKKNGGCVPKRCKFKTIEKADMHSSSRLLFLLDQPVPSRFLYF